MASTRSYRPKRDGVRRPSRSAPAYTSSASTQAPTRSAAPSTAASEVSSSRIPVGFCGLVTTTMRVSAWMAVRTSAGSGCQPCSSRSGIGRTSPARPVPSPGSCMYVGVSTATVSPGRSSRHAATKLASALPFVTTTWSAVTPS